MKINHHKLRMSLLTFLIFILFGVTYFFLFVEKGIAIPCVFHEITGYYCPGCGITRCLTSILLGQFYQAFRYHMLVFCLLPFALLYGSASYLYWLMDRRITKVPNYIWNLLFIVTVLFGIMRNTELFSIMAPTVIT